MNRAEQIIQAVRELVPTIRARSAEIEAARRIPLDLLNELTNVGCFRMLVPKQDAWRR
jgi:hypothetical protein